MLHHASDLLTQAAAALYSRFLPAQEVIFVSASDGSSPATRWIEVKSHLQRTAAPNEVAGLTKIGVGGSEVGSVALAEPQLPKLLVTPEEDLILFVLRPKGRLLGSKGDAGHTC